MLKYTAKKCIVIAIKFVKKCVNKCLPESYIKFYDRMKFIILQHWIFTDFSCIDFLIQKNKINKFLIQKQKTVDTNSIYTIFKFY